MSIQRLAKDGKGMYHWHIIDTPVKWRADKTMLMVNMPEATRMMTEYVEKFWCPTIDSEEILASAK